MTLGNADTFWTLNHPISNSASPEPNTNCFGVLGRQHDAGPGESASFLAALQPGSKWSAAFDAPCTTRHLALLIRRGSIHTIITSSLYYRVFIAILRVPDASASWLGAC